MPNSYKVHSATKCANSVSCVFRLSTGLDALPTRKYMQLPCVVAILTLLCEYVVTEKQPSGQCSEIFWLFRIVSVFVQVRLFNAESAKCT